MVEDTAKDLAHHALNPRNRYLGRPGGTLGVRPRVAELQGGGKEVSECRVLQRLRGVLCWPPCHQRTCPHAPHHHAPGKSSTSLTPGIWCSLAIARNSLHVSRWPPFPLNTHSRRCLKSASGVLRIPRSSRSGLPDSRTSHVLQGVAGQTVMSGDDEGEQFSRQAGDVQDRVDDVLAHLGHRLSSVRTKVCGQDERVATR